MTKNCLLCGAAFGPGKYPSMFKRKKYCGQVCGRSCRAHTPEQSLEIMWQKIDRNGPNGCWIWTGSTNSMGYGSMNYAGKTMVAVHRFLYQLAHGFIPADVWCLHKCDTPRCVNPGHIFLGDDAANNLDKMLKGRFRSKLKPDHVREIVASDEPTQVLATRHGVSIGTIRAVRSRRKWKHIQIDVPSTKATHG